MSKLQWKIWKEDKNIIDKFLEDYNLTLLEAALATTESITSKTFVDYKKNPEKASLYFLNKLSEFTDTPIEDLFETESYTRDNINIENKMYKINEFHNGILYSLKTKKNETQMQKLYHILDVIHLPIISSIGDEFSGKRKIFSEFEPCLKKVDFKSSVCFVVNEDYTLEIFKEVFDLGEFDEFESTKFIKLKNQKERVFNPRQIINKYYLKKWEPTNECDNFIIIFSKNDLFKNFTLIDYPEYSYIETQKNSIQEKDINLLIKHQYYADYCFYFGAISRFLTILDTPILKFIITHSSPKNSKLLATKSDLRNDITNLELSIPEIKLKDNNSYSLDIPLSFNLENYPKENIIKYDQSSLLKLINTFLTSYLSSSFIANLDLDELYSNFLQTLSLENENSGSENNDIKANQEILKQIFDELYATIIGNQDKNSINVISKWINNIKIKTPIGQSLSKKSFTELLSFMYEYIKEITEKSLKIDNRFCLLKKYRFRLHENFIVASLFLYFGNIILPFINSEKSFSKGTPDTWEKKIVKQINISKDHYDSYIKTMISILEV